MRSEVPPIADLYDVAQNATVEGAVWSAQSADLNVNLVVLEKAGVGEHVNREVDVLVVGVLGEGIVKIEGVDQHFGASQVVIIPKGARRELRPIGGRFAYLTCHRRRPGLWPAPLKGTS